MKLPVTLFSFVLIICECNLQKVTDDNNNEFLNTIQIIEKYGYPAEKHIVQTEDGYLLEMHRIPHGIANRTNFRITSKKRLPMYLQHGLLGTSADFVFLGPKYSLAFVLADLGFDVWMGNMRGNFYSRRHVKLSPQDIKFWDFSWHESGLHDIPSQIDYVTNHTNAKKIFYVGHSMGTTTFFVMASTLQQYNDKIELAMLLAPIAYLEHVRSPLIIAVLPFSSTLRFVVDTFAHGEFLPRSFLLQTFTEIFCTMFKIEQRLCKSVIFLITGADPKAIDKNTLEIFLGQYPSGYSTKGIYHYGQLAKSGEFRQFDYGSVGNIERYNSMTPPDYNLGSITANLIFYVGTNDYLSTIPDVKRLARELPSLRKLHVLTDPQFNHIDFLVRKDIKEVFYDVMMKDINDHLNKMS